MYSEKVMDHFQNPRNVGKMDDADGVGEVGNAVCGDIMKMYIKGRTASSRMSNSTPSVAVPLLPPPPWRPK